VAMLARNCLGGLLTFVVASVFCTTSRTQMHQSVLWPRVSGQRTVVSRHWRHGGPAGDRLELPVHCQEDPWSFIALKHWCGQ
jgi:hypothetical protein